MRPHGRQPTRLPRPWGSPAKNTGVGCHFLLQSIKVKSESEVAQSCPLLATPWTAAYQAPPSMGVSRQVYWSGLPLPSPSFLVHVVNHCLNSLLSFLCKSHSFPPKYSAQTVNPHSFKLIKEYIYFVFFSEIFLPYQSSLLLSRPIP